MYGRLIVVAVGALTLALGVASALAAGSGQGTITGADPISFTIAADACGDLPPGLTVWGTGTVRWHKHGSVDANGVVHTTVGYVINGTAFDSNTPPRTYVFNYRSGPNDIDLTFSSFFHTADHFNLVGNGDAPKIHAFFNIDLLMVNGSPTFHFSAHGDSEHCDPI